MKPLSDPTVVSRTACPDAQPESAVWMREVSRLDSLGGVPVTMAKLAVSVAQAGGSVDSAGNVASIVAQGLPGAAPAAPPLPPCPPEPALPAMPLAPAAPPPVPAPALPPVAAPPVPGPLPPEDPPLPVPPPVAVAPPLPVIIGP